MMRRDAEQTAAIVAAVDEIMLLDPDVWAMNACHFTQTEVEAFAGLLLACGREEVALVLYECWVDSEIEDGEARPGDWVVLTDPVELIWRGP